MVSTGHRRLLIVTNKPLDISLCRHIADQLQHRLDLVHKAENPQSQLASYGSHLFIAYREFGAENAVGAFILNCVPSEGWSGVALIALEYFFSPDSLGIHHLAEALNKQGLSTTQQELSAFGKEIKQLMANGRMNLIMQTLEANERSAA